MEAALQGLHAAGYGKDVEVVHTTLIPEDDVARRVIEVARDHHCDRIVVGRSPGDDEGRLDASVVDKLEDLASGDVDTLVVG